MRAALAEALGTGFLLIAVVGSGIMGESLSGGNTGLALLANALTTGFALYALITVLGPVSGAQFNPAVTLYMTLRGEMAAATAAAYIAAQIAGGILGVWLTHVMFDLPVLQLSGTARTGLPQWVSEVVATFGLLFVIVGGLAQARAQVPALVGAWIAGAYWFTSSTSFANSAVTIARALSDTFAGILPTHAPAFIVAQAAGVALALIVLPRLFPR